MGHRACPIAAQAALAHGWGAARVTQARRSAPRALYDLPGWAQRGALPTRYPASERTGQVHADQAGRRWDALSDQGAVMWGERVAKAARDEALAWPRRHADPMAMTFAGLGADHPAVAGVPRLEPGAPPGACA
jgi:hypothetical protein